MHAPLATASQKVEDGVKDLTRRPLALGRPAGLAGGMSGAKISHSRSERSLGYRQRDGDIGALHKASVLLIEPIIYLLAQLLDGFWGPHRATP